MGDPSHMRYRLVIGTKNISSWSLRPWLAMRQAGIPFAEIKIELRRPDTQANIGRYSPSGRVPALLVGDLAIWDSLAVLEYLLRSTRKPACGPLRSLPVRSPARPRLKCTRALPRCGSTAPWTLLRACPWPRCRIRWRRTCGRILALWQDCRRRHGATGPFLFGAFSAADAMYAPVAARFRTYLPDLTRHGGGLFALPGMLAWEEWASAEPLPGNPR